MSHLARETLISAAINAAISVAFFLLVFGASARVPVQGIGNYAIDFLPQSFAIGFMATLVPGQLARRALAAGRLSGSTPAIPPARVVARRAAANGMLALVIGGGLCAAALWASGVQDIGWAPAFTGKVLYGGALGALVTAISLNSMLR